MQRTIIAGALALALGATPALAANNTDCSTPSDQISGNSMAALLVNAAYNNATNRFAQDLLDHNNESLVSASTVVWDYKAGPAGAGNKDPESIVGSYAITGGSGRGTITYTYPVGGSLTFSYFISVVVPGSGHTGTGSYLFCATSGAPILSVTVGTGHF